MTDKIEIMTGNEKHKLCFNCNETFGVIISTNEETYLCFRCFRNKFGESDLAEILETADQTSALKGWRPLDKGISYNITKDIVEKAFEIFERETKIKDVFEQPSYDMPRTVHFESATFLLSLEEAPLQEINELKSKFADDVGLSDKLNKICNDRNRYILTSIYGDCPRCNVRSLIKKQKSKVLDTEICHVCSSQELIDDLVKRPLMSLEDYEIFFADHQSQMPSNNKDFVNTLVWNEFRLGTERDIVENFVRQKLHSIERHPVDQRGWCRYCEMFHTASIIPTKVRDTLEACPECVKICSKENLINENIAHTIKKHIKQDHKEIYKFIMQQDSTFYQWSFITPEEDERRRAEIWRQSMGDNTMDDYHRERREYVKKHYTFSRKEITEEDPNQVLPSMQNYPINMNGDTSEPDKGYENRIRVASKEIAEEVNKSLAVFKTPKIKSKLNRYDESKAISIIRNNLSEYMTILMADYESVVENKFNRKEFDKFIKNTLKEIAKNDTGTVKFEAYLNKLRKQTKEWKKINKRNELILKITNEIKRRVLDNIDDPSIKLKGRGIEVDPKIITGIIKKYSISDVEEEKVRELSTGLIEKTLARAVKAEIERNPVGENKINEKLDILNDIEEIISNEIITEYCKMSDSYSKRIGEDSIMDRIQKCSFKVKQRHKELTHDQHMTIKKLTTDKLTDLLSKQKRFSYLRKQSVPILKKEYKPRKEYIDYSGFQKFLQDNKILSIRDFIKFTEQNQVAENIPITPKSVESYYRNQGVWKGWSGACGIERKKTLSQDAIDDILDHILENFDAFMSLSDALLLYWFDSFELFGTRDPLKSAFFKNFIEWRDQEQGKKALYQWLTDRDFEKQHFGYTLVQKDEETKEEFFSRQYVSTTPKREQLFRTTTQSIDDILHHSRTFDPVDYKKNPKLFSIFVDFVVDRLMMSYIDDPNQQFNLRKNRQRFNDTVIDRFKDMKKIVNNLDYKQKEYRGQMPTILQKYGVYRARKKLGFLNMFGTGSGKTKIGFMLAKHVSAKRVFWVAPYNVVNQTNEMCLTDYPDSINTSVLDKKTDKTIPNSFINGVTSPKRTRFHFINYERFNNKTNGLKLIGQLKDTKIDLLVLDEGQRVKSRKDESSINERTTKSSNTRQNILELVRQLRLKNPNMKVLILTATPIINNIREAMSIYEILTSSTLNMSGQNNIKNGMRMYVELLPYSVRFEQKYDIDVIQKPIVCEGFLPDNMSEETAQNLSWLDIEQIATKYRIPEMIVDAKSIMEKDPNAKILIYTDLKTGIVDQLVEAFNEHKEFKIGLFHGDDKSGMVQDMGIIDGKRKFFNPFVKGDVNILIATRSIAVGIDGIQTVCNHIFFNGLVWTWADFEQIRGRLVRTGQYKNKVFVHMFFATINGFPYDLNLKYKRIIRKKGLGELVRDGRLPKDIDTGITKQEKKEFIETCFKNRISGFPTKEELELKHSEIAQKQIEAEVEELEEQFPEVDLGGFSNE